MPIAPARSLLFPCFCASTQISIRHASNAMPSFRVAHPPHTIQNDKQKWQISKFCRRKFCQADTYAHTRTTRHTRVINKTYHDVYIDSVSGVSRSHNRIECHIRSAQCLFFFLSSLSRDFFLAARHPMAAQYAIMCRFARRLFPDFSRCETLVPSPADSNRLLLLHICNALLSAYTTCELGGMRAINVIWKIYIAIVFVCVCVRFSPFCWHFSHFVCTFTFDTTVFPQVFSFLFVEL